MRRPRPACTLIELLVVITIVAVRIGFRWATNLEGSPINAVRYHTTSA